MFAIFILPGINTKIMAEGPLLSLFCHSLVLSFTDSVFLYVAIQSLHE